MDPVSIIVGLAMNFYTLSNIDFFQQRAINEKKMDCEWEYVGQTKPDPNNTSLTIFGDVYFKHNCETKKSEHDSKQ